MQSKVIYDSRKFNKEAHGCLFIWGKGQNLFIAEMLQLYEMCLKVLLCFLDSLSSENWLLLEQHRMEYVLILILNRVTEIQGRAILKGVMDFQLLKCMKTWTQNLFNKSYCDIRYNSQKPFSSWMPCDCHSYFLKEYSSQPCWEQHCMLLLSD